MPVRIQVDLPNGIRLASLSTDTVYIYVDRSVTAEIELDVELTDYVLTDGLLLGQPVYTPKTVTVEGPEGEIKRHFAPRTRPLRSGRSVLRSLRLLRSSCIMRMVKKSTIRM